ncbi:MAG: thioredoxin family protein [Deltaproteobacteria bacterium]|nr:thioredoxin family protein [Deltaproteobacteria bacterium]
MQEPRLLTNMPLASSHLRVLFARAGMLCCAVLFLLSASISSSSGQSPQDLNVVRVEAHASHERIHPGESFQIAIVASIKQGFHINSHKPTDQLLMPTVVKFDEREGISFGPVSYPTPALKSFSFSPDKVSVYEGKTVMRTQAKLPENIAVGDMNISGSLAYQACDDQRCFMPTSAKFEIPLEIVEPGQTIKLTNKDVFQQKASLTSNELYAKQVIERGLPYALVAFFLFGLALNLTPCVYPVIPITVSFFVAQKQQKSWGTFFLALYYVVGIAIVFSVLGLISGLAGKQWGFLFQSPWFIIVITIIILSMAASMFGAFEITVPSFLMTPMGKSRQGAIGSLIMGLTVGVVIAPCAAGIIIGLVGIVAKLGIVAKGALLFFVMGLGLGLPYLFLATFSGFLNRLPRSGMWMVWIRKLFGLLLIGVAIYFLLPQAKQVNDQQGFYLGVLGIFGGVFLGFLGHGEGYTRTFKTIRAFFGILLIVSGIWLVNAAIRPESPAIDWMVYEAESIDSFQTTNRPVLIEFWADWCAACQEMERKTFRDQRVLDMSRELVMLRVNCTTPDNQCSALIKRFGVSGLPTVIFIGPNGQELKGLRAVGYLGPAEMLKKMEAAIPRSTGSEASPS